MPARSVVRPGLPGRIRNPYYNIPNTAPNSAASINPSWKTAYASPPTSALPSSRSQPTTPPPTGLEGHIASNGVSDVQTPYGKVSLLFTNGTPAIKQNVVFAVPQNQLQSSSLGTLTTKGTVLYTYQLSNEHLTPVPISATGGIYYQSPYMQSQTAAALSAYSTAKAQLAYYAQITQHILPNFQKAANTATNWNVIQTYGQLIQSYDQTANQLAFQAVFNKGQFAGYSAKALEQVAQLVVKQNAPVEVAAITTTGLKSTNTNVVDTIFGVVNGKSQNLGSLIFKPMVSGNAISLIPNGFSPSTVQVSGQGWNAGIRTSFNPSTGQISINPHNFTFVNGNLQTSTSSNGEVIKSITMPTGFGISQKFPQGLNYLNIANIPITAPGGYKATESYTQTGASPGVFSLSWSGNFPASATNSVSLSNGLTEVAKSVRSFNPSTGAITYSSARYFSVPGKGLFSASNPISTNYFYGGKNYVLNFNPSSGKYSLSSPTTTASTPAAYSPISSSTGLLTYSPISSVQSKAVRTFSSLGSASNLQSSTNIQLIFNPQGQVSAETTFSSTGEPEGGMDFIKPLFVAGANIKSTKISNNTLVLPISAYNQYIQGVNANSSSAAINAKLSAQSSALYSFDAQLPFGNTIADLEKVYNPILGAYQAGEVFGSGNPVKGLTMFGTSLAEGEVPVFVIAAPVASLTSSAIAAASQAATNAVTGKPITNNLVLAASLGADFGGIFGATLPEGASAINVAKTVGLNAVKMGIGFGAFNAAVSVSEAAFGGNPATSSGAIIGTSPRNQSQGSTGKSQSSFSLLSNYTPTEYLNLAVGSFAQGFTTGTEFAGAFGATSAGLGILSKSGSTSAVTITSLLQSKALMSVGTAALVGGGTLASGGTLRQAVVGGVASAGLMYGFMGLSEQFNPKLKLGTAGEPSTVMAIRPGPEEEGSGTTVTGNNEGNGLMRTNPYGSLEYRVAVKTPYANGNIVDVGTGAMRTLTAEATETAPEVSDIFSGQMKVERTITVEPTRVQQLFGIGPKVITQSFFTQTPEAVSTLLSQNPAIVVSQPGGIETTPELSDVYNTAGIKPEGPTTVFHESVATPQGQEWLGETGNTKGFNLVGKTSKFVLLEVGPNSALPSAEDLFAGRPGELKASAWEGPKSPTKAPFFTSDAVPENFISGEATVAKSALETSGDKMSSVQLQTQTQKSYVTQIPAVPQMPAVELVSSVGVDPAIVLGTAVQRPSTIQNSSILSRSLGMSGITRTSVIGTFTRTQKPQQGSKSSYNSGSKSLYNSISRLDSLPLSLTTNQTSNQYDTASAYKMLLTGSLITLQTQKQSPTQKQVGKGLSSSVGIPNIADIGIKVPWGLAPPKRYPTKKNHKKQYSTTPTTFAYLPDVHSVLMGLHGKKSRKKFYRSTGMSRPIL